MRKDIIQVVKELNMYMRENMMPGGVVYLGSDNNTYQLQAEFNDKVVYDFVKTYLHYENYEAILREVKGNNTIIYVAK